MLARPYYTLIASLPPLPRFDRAKALPINPERLEARLRMLEPEDASVAERAQDFLRWQRQPMTRTDAWVVRRYRELMAEVANPTLRAMIDYRLQLRTVMAALRRRTRGLGPPRPGENWGAGPFVRWIEQHWQAPDFDLGAVYPWVAEARRLHEVGETLELERLLMGMVWDHLTRLEDGRVFTFDAVLIYLFKWDILRRWLAHDVAGAAARFEALVDRTLGEHGRLFA